jgi:hypothetical protein
MCGRWRPNEPVSSTERRTELHKIQDLIVVDVSYLHALHALIFMMENKSKLSRQNKSITFPVWEGRLGSLFTQCGDERLSSGAAQSGSFVNTYRKCEGPIFGG